MGGPWLVAIAVVAAFILAAITGMVLGWVFRGDRAEAAPLCPTCGATLVAGECPNCARKTA